MTKVYVLSQVDYDDDGYDAVGTEIIGVFSSRADAERIRSVHEFDADVEECELDALAKVEVVTEWIVSIDALTACIAGSREKLVLANTDFVPYDRIGRHFEVRSRTSLEHAMKFAEEESRKWLAVRTAESSPHSLEAQPAAVATCFYCRATNAAKPGGDASGPMPNLWGYARDGAGELLCCSRCLADYHAGQPVRLVPMEHPADGIRETVLTGGTATMVEPFTLPTRPWS